ncbi:hypothetical protein F7725_014961 [Dissostichus mawsoni]|uniref:Uncharacterized protein n=1 Tax=Dissostichus mawsoni TaxID=36200 RepID=A0A7J5YG80_DISMA|nr:hypothetical protein F7725_014961 [Dissostichus mawsoni]
MDHLLLLLLLLLLLRGSGLQAEGEHNSTGKLPPPPPSLQSAASAQHLCVLLDVRGLRGPAAGVPGVQRLHLQHQLLHPASVPGGSFQLNFTSINSANNYYSLPAVNHSAHFLFPSAEPPTRETTAVFITSLFFLMTSPLRASALRHRPRSRTFYHPSRRPAADSAVVTVGLYFYCKATRGRRPGRQEDIELDNYNLGVPAEEEGAQGAE